MDPGLTDKIALIYGSGKGPGKPEKLESMVTFPAPQRAAYVAGMSITVDGGRVRRVI